MTVPGPHYFCSCNCFHSPRLERLSRPRQVRSSAGPPAPQWPSKPTSRVRAWPGAGLCGRRLGVCTDRRQPGKELGTHSLARPCVLSEPGCWGPSAATSRASATALARAPGSSDAAVAGRLGHPPRLSPAMGRAAPFLSAPRPARLHQSRRRAVHVERGVRSVRREPAGGCPHLGLLYWRPRSPTRSLPTARRPSKLAPSTLCLPPYGPLGPSVRELRCPIHPWVPT